MKTFVTLTALLFSLSAISAPQFFTCKNYDGEAAMELVLGDNKNHLKMIKDEAPLKKGESATFLVTSVRDFFKANVITNLRTIQMSIHHVGDPEMMVKINYDLDPACPSCESGHAGNDHFTCEKTKDQKYRPNKYFEYVREPHYPTSEDFQWTMREVAEDHWSPREQITLVTKDGSDWLVVNFDDNRIWLHGWTKNSGPNSFMLEMIQGFMKYNPIILEEATNAVGKCLFNSFVKTGKINESCRTK